MKTIIALQPARKRNFKTVQRKKKARFERAVNDGRARLTEAISTLIGGNPDGALALINAEPYPVAALLAKELTELSGEYVPVSSHSGKPRVTGMHLVNLIQQVWSEALRQTDALEIITEQFEEAGDVVCLVPDGSNPNYCGDELELMMS